MSINQILNTGASSILAHQAAIATASKNAANVSTQGYSKGDAIFSSHGSAGGVRYEEVRRTTSTYFAQRLLFAEGRAAKAEAAATSLIGVESLFVDDEGGVGQAVDDFFNTVRALSGSPTDPDMRRAMVEHGKALTESIAVRADSLAAERRRVDQSLDGMIDRANVIISDIADLNEKIGGLSAIGDPAGDLLDQRDLLLQELSQHVDISKIDNHDGQVTVLFKGGIPLVDGNLHATLTANPDANYDDMRRIDLIDVSGVAHDITTKVEVGKIGGVLELRDQIMPELIDRLDQFAFDLATNFNALHSTGFGMDGLNGRNFFANPGGVAGAASALMLTPTVEADPNVIAASTTAAGAVGDNDNLFRLQDVEDATIAGGGSRTLREEVADMTAFVGRIVRDNRHEVTTSTGELRQISAMKESQTGVSLDEEMIDLVRFQRAFQAGAKIIQTVDEMLQTLVSM